MRAVVIKVGGAQVNPSRLSRLARLVAERRRDDLGVILVHGGGSEVARIQEAMGHPPRKVRGLRVTPEPAMDAVTAALRGLVNSRVVAALVARDLPALGLCGADLCLLRSDFLNSRELGRVGGPPSVNVERLGTLLQAGLLPVLASVCMGPDGRLLNVNADTVAHSVAVALGAQVLEFVSDVPGVLSGWTARQVLCRLPGGDLEIEWSETDELSLTGPAVEVFRGEWTCEPPGRGLMPLCG